MRNAMLESISHKLFVWLFVVYQLLMRIWEMKIIFLVLGKPLGGGIFNWCTHDCTVMNIDIFFYLLFEDIQQKNSIFVL